MRGASIMAAMATALLVPLASAKCALGAGDVETIVSFAKCSSPDEVANCVTGKVEYTQLYDCLVSSGCDKFNAKAILIYHESGCEEDAKVTVEDLRARGRRALPRAPTPTINAAADAARITAAPPLVTARQEEGPGDTCLATTLVSTSACSQVTVSPDKVEKVCQPTTVAQVSCKDGMLCTKTELGETLCMVRQDVPPLSGIIASSFLAGCFCVMFGSVLFMGCRSRRRNRHAEKQREAMLIASGAKSGLGPSASEAHLPLMDPVAEGGGARRNRDISADYSAPRAYGDRRNHSRHASPGGSPFRDGSGLRTETSPGPSGSGDVGLGSSEARNPMNMDDNDISYGRHN